MTWQVPLLVPVCFCILPVCSHVLKLQCRPAGGVSADISMLLHVSQVADVSLQLLGGGVGSDVQTLMGVQGEAACLLQTSSRRRRRCRCAGSSSSGHTSTLLLSAQGPQPQTYDLVAPAEQLATF